MCRPQLATVLPSAERAAQQPAFCTASRSCSILPSATSQTKTRDFFLGIEYGPPNASVLPSAEKLTPWATKKLMSGTTRSCTTLPLGTPAREMLREVPKASNSPLGENVI